MNFKNLDLQKIADTGVVAVIRAENAEQAEKIADSCAAGGIIAIEITYTVPGASEVIKKLTSKSDLIIGAGTVIEPETAEDAIAAGAKYIVGPNLDLRVAYVCQRRSIPYIPGCMTITEIINAMHAKAELIKLFPGSAFGPDYIKAIKGPLPNVNIMPTGGVNLDNVSEWIKNGCVAVGIGGELTKGAKTGDYELITTTAKKIIDAVKEARK